MERPVPHAIRGVHQGAAVEEETDGGAMVSPRCAVERRAGDVVLVLKISTGVEQEFDDLFKTNEKSKDSSQRLELTKHLRVLRTP